MALAAVRTSSSMAIVVRIMGPRCALRIIHHNMCAMSRHGREMAASPAAPDAAPTAPSDLMPIEPSLEADRGEFPALFDGPNVLVGCTGQQAIVEAAESLAGRNQPDLEVRQHAADREPQAADIIGEVGRIYRVSEEAIGEFGDDADIG